MQGADVVACTLASAGGDLLSLLEGKPMFDALIIDEARLALRRSECVYWSPDSTVADSAEAMTRIGCRCSALISGGPSV